MKTPPFSINNKLILAPYQLGQGLKSEVRSGVAFVSQKTNLVGLEVLVEARLEDGSFVPAGAIAYIPEESFYLANAKWCKDILRCPALGDKQFIVVDKQHVVMFDTKEEVAVNS